ncbi:phospholipase D-like domain-containing protein [Jannaschia sp. R86511]|uniref:phospholipase D-like domain-containing protein n=1 Tax=Jannaschia sp. R86511 TaxID=3093853 RepID=UPI0036D31326
MGEHALPTGIYESLLTQDLRARLADLRAITVDVPEGQQASALGDHVGRQVARALAGLAPDERVALVNTLLAGLHGEADVVEPGPQQLMSIARQEQPGVWTLVGTRPAVPLSRPALLTNSHTDPKLGAELRAELATADRVDLLCAFVKWYGLRVLEDQLKELKQRGVPLRVLTTTYMGATDRTALDRLVRDFGAEVKVNYETQSTRLHAKAWLFRRHSGYDTAYVGSSNLSRAALLDGLEWNVKLAGSHTPETDCQVRGHLRHLLGRPGVRHVRPGPGPRPARPGARCGWWAAGARHRHTHHQRARGSALPASGGDP